MTNPSNTEIQERHDATLFIDWEKEIDPNSQPQSFSNVQMCHTDRGILLKRLKEANNRAEYWKAEHIAGNKVIESAEAKLKATQESLRAHMRVISTLRDKHGVSADLIGDIFDEEES